MTAATCTAAVAAIADYSPRGDAQDVQGRIELDFNLHADRRTYGPHLP
jgi:hypothetical protein